VFDGGSTTDILYILYLYGNGKYPDGRGRGWGGGRIWSFWGGILYIKLVIKRRRRKHRQKKIESA
jgi:hypothetical protein